MKLVFASSAALSFAQRAAIARLVVADAALASLGRTSAAWLGATRLAIYFRTAPNAAAVAARVVAARDAVLSPAVAAAPAKPKRARKARTPKAPVLRTVSRSTLADGELRDLVRSGHAAIGADGSAYIINADTGERFQLVD